MPFRYDKVVYGQGRTDHDPPNAIDFNGLRGGDTDLGMPVVAAAAGRVLLSKYYTKDTNIGYGQAILIGHGDGQRTFYAHLRDRRVDRGDRVRRGQLIGHLGQSSATDDFSPHLRYEQRLRDSVVRARFNGKVAPVYSRMGESVKMRSRNLARARRYRGKRRPSGRAGARARGDREDRGDGNYNRGGRGDRNDRDRDRRPRVRGKVEVVSGADRPGVETKPRLMRFLRRVAGFADRKLIVSTGTNHSKYTSSGSVSDHWVGLAADFGSVLNGFSINGKGGTRIAAAGLRAAGLRPKRARRIGRSGGGHNVCWHDKRIQVIWRTGDHYDHVHIGLARQCSFRGVQSFEI